MNDIKQSTEGSHTQITKGSIINKGCVCVFTKQQE